MNEHIELGTFGELLNSHENLSKIIEVAIKVDEGVCLDATDSDLKFKSYAHALKELLELKHEPDDYETSICLELKTDEFSEDNSKYVDVHLINDNYSETIVVQPEVNFDDYNNYKTFAMDFVPWNQLLNKNVRVSSEVVKLTPVGCTVQEFALGNILWELTFYGFNSSEVDEKSHELKELSNDTESLIEVDVDTFLQDTNE